MDAFDGFKVLVATLCMTAATAAFDQNSQGSGERGSIPPGQSKDGAAPADGAIKGGSILPGEQSGVPDQAKSQARCDELLGSLREDCLERERSAASGGTREITRDPWDRPDASDTRTRSPERAD
jgi:hypothetical protein